ncbi:MAG: hypothetical protein KJ607_12430 [Bacteroidetes bacterium]|nr:hypothetical protein [Bacteroidota bacterium]
MELTINIGFDQILKVIRQLPANQIRILKTELTEELIATKAEQEISEFQKFLMEVPVMTDEQYKNFIEARKL